MRGKVVRMRSLVVVLVGCFLSWPALADRDRIVDHRGSDPHATNSSPLKRYGDSLQAGTHLTRQTIEADDGGALNSRVVEFGAALKPMDELGISATLGQSGRMGEADIQQEELAIGLGGAYHVSDFQIGLGLRHSVLSEKYESSSVTTSTDYSKTIFTLGGTATFGEMRMGVSVQPKVVTDHEYENSYDDGDETTAKSSDIDPETHRLFAAYEIVKNVSLQLDIERTYSAMKKHKSASSTHTTAVVGATTVTVGGWFRLDDAHRILASVGRHRTEQDRRDAYNLTTLGYDWSIASSIVSADIVYGKLLSDVTLTGFTLAYTHVIR